MATILDLASELILVILLELDVRDILACKQICRRFRELAESSVVQYKCHLAFAGAVDGSARSPSVAKRLHSLKDYQLAWRTLSLVFDPAFSSTGHLDRSYPFRHLPFSGPLVAMHVGTELRLYRPASPGRQVKAMTWSLDLTHLGLTPLMGASDLGEDVVAICGEDIVHKRFCCRFLTLLPDGTMVPHPFAPQAPLKIHSIRHPQSVAHVAMHGDLLLLRAKLSRGGNALYVLDWKTGRILLHMEKASSPIIFHVLCKNLVLISLQEELAIHVLDPANHQIPPYSVPPLCLLGPPPHMGFYLKDIPHQPLVSPIQDGGLFSSDPEAALLVIHFAFRSQPSGTPFDYVLCIPRATLLARLGLSTPSAESAAASRPFRAAHMLEWEDWTGGGTLLRFSRYTFSRLQVATFGSRVAVMSNRVQFDRLLSEAPTDVRVFEIHPWARASSVRPQISQDGLEEIDFTAESEEAVAQLEDSLPFYVSHTAIAQEGDAPPELDKEYILLLEDGLAMLREQVLEDGEMRTTTHCYLSAA